MESNVPPPALQCGIETSHPLNCATGAVQRPRYQIRYQFRRTDIAAWEQAAVEPPSLACIFNVQSPSPPPDRGTPCSALRGLRTAFSRVPFDSFDLRNVPLSWSFPRLPLQFLLLAVLLGTPTSAVRAQAATPALTDDSLRRATMAGWIQRHRIHVLDRSHSYGGWMYNRDEYGFGTPIENNNRQIEAETLELYDRGVFRHLTPNMDREYGLDMWGYRFTGGSTYRWQHAPNGLRVYAGSIERTTGAISTEIKQTLSSGAHTFNVRAHLQQHASARRALLDLGYRWQITDAHAVGVRHTFAEYKPDFDATLFYRFTDPQLGTARLAATAQNLYNDFLYATLGTAAEDELLVRTYGKRPVLLSATVTSSSRYRLRGELHASVQPKSELELTAQNTPDFHFQQNETLYFLSGLLEYQFPYATTGIVYRRDFNQRHRFGSSGSVQADYTATQTTSTVGAFLLADWWKLHAEVWALSTQYRDHQTGQHFGLSTLDGPIDYREPHRRGKIRVRYRPDTSGPSAGLEYLFLQRGTVEDGSQMTRQWTGEFFTIGSSNYRLAVLLGYEFKRGSFTAGVGIDTDNDDLPAGIPDSPGRFDNGFGRLTVYW